MNPLWRDTLTSFVRRILVYLAGILAMKGFIDDELGNRIITEGSVEIATSLIMFAGVTWASNKSKVRAWFRTVLAHKADPGTSLAEVLAEAHMTPVAGKKKTVEKELTPEALNQAP